jgi:hypothetical protein
MRIDGDGRHAVLLGEAHGLLGGHDGIPQDFQVRHVAKASFPVTGTSDP